MKYFYLLLSLIVLDQSKAQLVVDLATFASNPARYNGKYIVIRGVNISKSSSKTLSLTGPQVTPATSPTGGTTNTSGGISSGTAVPITPNQPGTISLNTGTTNSTITGTASGNNRVAPCSPPVNWEILNVEVPNYNACYAIYSQMATNIPSGRVVNADLTLQVNTRLLHRVVRVKIN